MTAILRAAPAHAKALAALHEAVFPPSETWNEAAFATQLGLPGTAALIHGAEGFILLRVAADEAEILTLAVLPEARRRGIARTLLQAAMEAARHAGAALMFLEVAADNLPARSLYEEAGFTRAGARRAYYGPGRDAFILRRAL